MTVQLDAEIRRLLFERVASFEELEALLLLQRTPASALSVAAVAAALRRAPPIAEAALTGLAARHLLTLEENASSPTFRYAPSDAATAEVVGRLARLYTEQPVEIIKQMSANAIARLRSSAARAFSDAFIFKGRKDDR